MTFLKIFIGIYSNKDFIFMQDAATSHTSNLCQNYLMQELGTRFITKNEWPPASPDCNPLDYYFWDALSTAVYGCRREPFQDLDELKSAIKRVWRDVAGRIDILRKAIDQFRPRLRAVVKENGGCIKMHFG